LSWNAVNGATTYIVRWDPPSSLGRNNKPVINKSSTVITGFQSNTEYTFTIVASRGNVSSQPSSGTTTVTGKKNVKKFILSVCILNKIILNIRNVR